MGVTSARQTVETPTKSVQRNRKKKKAVWGRGTVPQSTTAVVASVQGLVFRQAQWSRQEPQKGGPSPGKAREWKTRLGNCTELPDAGRAGTGREGTVQVTT